MRMRTAPTLPAGFGRLDRVLIALPLVALLAQMLLVAPIAQAAPVYPNPPNATPVAWPSSFTSYTNSSGTPISDVEGESGVGSVYDISSGGGGATSTRVADGPFPESSADFSHPGDRVPALGFSRLGGCSGVRCARRRPTATKPTRTTATNRMTPTTNHRVVASTGSS